MSAVPLRGEAPSERPPGDGFDFTLVLLDDAGVPHLAVSAEPVAAVADRSPGPGAPPRPERGGGNDRV
jgi:hypothetical protein